MQKYFNKDSMEGKTEDIIKKISYRYINDNPDEPFTYRAYNTLGFERAEDGRCIIDFDKKFPDAKCGDYAYAFSKIYSETDGICCLAISCKNPSEVYVNGEKATATTCLDEVVNERRAFDFKVHKGYNTIFIKSKKNVLGFKCIIGCYSPKWLPVNFYTAFAENNGELGWNYCGTYAKDIIKEIPAENSKMPENWLPKVEDNILCNAESTVYAVSFLRCIESKVKLKIKSGYEFKVYIDGNFVFGGNSDAENDFESQIGIHSIAIEFTGTDGRFGTEFCGAELFLPNYIKGVRGEWLYVNTNDKRARNGFDEFTLYGEDKEYFKSGCNSYIRPVLERPIFGKSNYPIGVALYGLLKAGKWLNDSKITDYVHSHLTRCCKIKDYSEWDCEKFGSACVNHQLLHLSSLDDCGSFASTILEDYFNNVSDDCVLPMIDYIGDYIRFKQERLDTGAFYREMKGEFFQYTVWADDLYMATPFLMRYARLKNDESILEDAINQFLQFEKLLFMKDKRLMSHVYNLKYDKQTGVPWGRGNGWVLFSLSELLMVLPKENDNYEKIKNFFVELCEGFFEVMDENGMCHQVLDDEESYAEASSTAMCAAAFARGIRLGVLTDDKYAHAAIRAADSLCRYCIDCEGNIYGVCVGSGYSFRREYYKNELAWNINDTHGTGIVLIALEEVENLKKR